MFKKKIKQELCGRDHIWPTTPKISTSPLPSLPTLALTHLRIGSRHDVSSFQITSVCAPYTHFHNCDTAINIRTLDKQRHLIHTLNSYFTTCPSNNFYNKRIWSRIMCYNFIVISSVWNNSVVFSQLVWPDAFENYRPVIYRMSFNLGSSDIFSGLDSGCALSGRETCPLPF